MQIRVEGSEVPILDGAAATWYDHIWPTCIPADSTQTPLRLTRTVRVEDGERWIVAEPADELSLDVTVSYPRLGTHRICGQLDLFLELKGARTFGFFEDHEHLKKMGLARGASLENTLVFTEDGQPMNPGAMPYGVEIAGHKWLDLLGDLALVGRPVFAQICAHRPGHMLNHRLVRALLNEGNDST